MINLSKLKIRSNIIHVHQGEYDFFKTFMHKHNRTWPKDERDQGIFTISKSMVGIINTPVRQIELQPKYHQITLNHVSRMYRYVFGYNGAADDNMLNINNNGFNIVNLFLKRLKLDLSLGLPKGYVSKTKRHRFWKGNVKIIPSYINAKMLQDKPVISKTYDLSLDTALNRIIKAALMKLSKDSKYRVQALSLLTSFKNVTYIKRSGIYMYNQISFNHRNRMFKKIALESEMIIDNLFIDTSLGHIGGDSFLINFDLLFEAFARKILSSIPGEDFTPNKTHSVALLGKIYNDQNKEIDHRNYIPDIIYNKKDHQECNNYNPTAFGVLDVKNKAFSQFKLADVYQVSLYAAILMAKKVILIYPSFHDRTPEIMRLNYKYIYRQRIYATFVNIAVPSGKAFKRSIKKFVNQVLNILHN